MTCQIHCTHSHSNGIDVDDDDDIPLSLSSVLCPPPTRGAEILRGFSDDEQGEIATYDQALLSKAINTIDVITSVSLTLNNTSLFIAIQAGFHIPASPVARG